MSLVRALTTRRQNNKTADVPDMLPYIGRAASQRAGKPVVRAQISSPLALLSTSNVLLNNAQDIPGTSPIEFGSASSASSDSGHDTDASAGSIHSTDASSVDESPIEPNHLSCYFKPNVNTVASSPATSPNLSRDSLETPKLPQRVPSHSKKAHESLHRKRTIQRIMSPPPSRGHEVARNSTEMFNPSHGSETFVEASSPFGNELAQLDEVAEEFGMVVRDAEDQDDAEAMKDHSLAHFGASDYMTEIQSLLNGVFADESSTPSWI